MNSEDQFESRLRQQPPRPLPPGWRQEILSAARQAASGRAPVPNPRRSAHSAFISYLSTLNSRLSTVFNSRLSTAFWPHPAAWAGLAAAWLLIAGLDFAASEPSAYTVARRPPPPSPQLRELLRQQDLMLAELIGLPGKPAAQPATPPVPQPRSQRGEESMHT